MLFYFSTIESYMVSHCSANSFPAKKSKDAQTYSVIVVFIFFKINIFFIYRVVFLRVLTSRTECPSLSRLSWWDLKSGRGGRRGTCGSCCRRAWNVKRWVLGMGQNCGFLFTV
jgi:hypothetical protein